MSQSLSKALCPCGSEQEYKSCCLPLIEGKKKATTAEELLRSRYAAFVHGAVDYIVKTHHSKTRSDVKREEIEDWSKNSEWLGLRIVQKEAGEAKDETGTIVFCAGFRARDSEKVEEHWEQSLFEKESGEWRFLDARGVQVGPYKRETPKIGRNDACPCGSGKKYKKCCAA